MELGLVIQEAITKKGKTQKRISEEIGKSTTAITNIVKGKFFPNADTMEGLSKSLDMPIAAFELLSVKHEGLPKEVKKLLIEAQSQLRESLYGKDE